MNIGFIGGGAMAEALIKGLIVQGETDIVVAEPVADRRQYVATAYGVQTSASNQDVASACDVIILSVKPQQMEAVLDEIAPVVQENKIVISIAAGITLAVLQAKLKTKKVVRVMPNVAAVVQECMTIISLPEGADDRAGTVARDIFESVGQVLFLPEHQMNAMTTISGCGPAFVALFIEAMMSAGVKMGLSEEHAASSALQTFVGATRLLETGLKPEQLRAIVTSPGGVTAEGIKAFQDAGLDDLVATALLAARRKADELGNA